MNALGEWQSLQDRSFLHRAIRRDREEAYWARYAVNYDVRRSWGEGIRRELEIISGLIAPPMSILEIGAGTGAFTVPLSRIARRITAVEPSPSMRRILREKLEAEGISNVEIVPFAWENAPAVPHDIVLAAGCCYAFYDVQEALRKMLDNARQRLILTAGDDGQENIYQACARSLGVPDPCAGPGYIHLYNVLYEMGILADIRILKSRRNLIYDDLEHAVGIWAERLEVPEEALPKLRAYLEERLLPMPSGHLTMGEIEAVTAVISYSKE